MKKAVAIIIICGLIFSTLISVISFVNDDWNIKETQNSSLNEAN
jgi:hypothetical protein